MSKIIVFEGADRCGKATQSQVLKETLESQNMSATVVEVPIKDGFLYNVIYWMLENGLAKKFPRLFQMTNFFNKWLFQMTKLTELEHKYDFIIFDRWSLSAVIYGTAEGLDPSFCERLYRNLRKPDFTVLLIGKPYKQESEDVYESDDVLQNKVRELYTKWADRYPRETYVLDGTNKSKIEMGVEVLKTMKILRVIPM